MGVWRGWECIYLLEISCNVEHDLDATLLTSHVTLEGAHDVDDDSDDDSDSGDDDADDDDDDVLRRRHPDPTCERCYWIDTLLSFFRYFCCLIDTVVICLIRVRFCSFRFIWFNRYFCVI